MAEQQSATVQRPLPSKQWLESWAAYFDKRAEDLGTLHIGPDERRMMAQTFRDLSALSEKKALTGAGEPSTVQPPSTLPTPPTTGLPQAAYCASSANGERPYVKRYGENDPQSSTEQSDDPFCWYRSYRDASDEWAVEFSTNENCPGPNWKPLYAAPVSAIQPIPCRGCAGRDRDLCLDKNRCAKTEAL